MATNNSLNLKSAGMIYFNAGAYTAYNPLDVGNGGTGLTSATAYAVLCAGTTSTGAWQSIASLGSSGNFLTSNGASALPSMQSAGTTNLGYAIKVITTGANPLDGNTYYLIDCENLVASTTATQANTRYYISTSGTINKVYGQFQVVGTLGSTENTSLYLRKNNTTDTAISTTLKLNAADVTFSATALSISVSAGDYIQVKMVCPTWATNPTLVSFNCTFMVE